MATGQYHRQTSGAFTVEHRQPAWFDHLCRQICCRKSYYKEQWVVVITEADLVNHGRTTSTNGQTSRCRHCCTSQMTEPLRGRSMGSYRGGCICRSTQQCPGITGIRVIFHDLRGDYHPLFLVVGFSAAYHDNIILKKNCILRRMLLRALCNKTTNSTTSHLYCLNFTGFLSSSVFCSS